MKEKFSKLIDVKSIVTICIIDTLCGLAIVQNIKIPSELFASVVSSIMTYFFTKRNGGEA